MLWARSVLRFSPRFDRGVVAKQQMVKAIQHVATEAGLETRDDEGRFVVTGRAFRIGGARHMIRRGVGVPPTMVLARLDSMCVLRYAKEAPLKNLTQQCKRSLRLEKGANSNTRPQKWRR